MTLGRSGAKKAEDHSTAVQILRRDELTDEIRNCLKTETETEVPEILVEDVVDKLFGPLTAELRSAVEKSFAIFASNSLQDEKKRHQQFRDCLVQLYQLVQAYNEGAELFEGL